jgi:SAM-dependent methyltransferase
VKNSEPVMSFGEEIAAMYGDLQRGDETAAVAFLADLAGGGPALELAIGTGRIALPLAARGIHVDGVDISPAMVAGLRLRERWASWDRSPFTATSSNVVSVYAR